MKNLGSLDLSHNYIGDLGAEAIANSPNMKNLSLLNLSDNEIGAAGEVAIRARFPFAFLYGK